MDFDPAQPIWTQLVAEFARRIATGSWAPDARLPSVRDLAGELAVNPNTVQRALAELERQGLVRTERTTGRFVTSDEAAIRTARLHLAERAADSYTAAARGLHLTVTEATELIRDRWEKDTRS